MTVVEVRPVGPDEVEAVGRLFAAARTTRHCWCMAFCARPVDFAIGWFGGGNRRRFASMAAARTPMGVLALVDATPVGWAACGPRSRYLGPDPSTHRLLGGLPRVEDDTHWLLPCLFVHPDHRGRGISPALIDGAVRLARGSGAVALDAWPLVEGATRTAEAFVGRQVRFADRGFRPVARPGPDRVLMRLDLATH